ncbi:MAG: hypothetical protein EBR82_27925 [Caulobacteraceae bacterium]|nr:hypothetical protein [Caulobacteraceae bacterium]
MAVTDVQQLECTGGGTIDGERSASVLYRVITDDRRDDFLIVLAGNGIPRRGESYQFGNSVDPYMYAQSASASLQSSEDSLKVWQVTVEYSTKGLERDPNQEKQDPLDWRPKCSTFSMKVRRPMLKDCKGKLIASSAGEPYDPPQERDETKFGIRIVRNVAKSDPGKNSEYKDTINSDTFWGNPPGTVKVEVPGTATEMFSSSGQRYYEETWEFAIEPEGWDLKLYDYGFYKIEGTKRVQIEGLVSAALLNGSGALLPVGNDPVLLPPFEPYKRKRFASLNLPRGFKENN